MFKTMNINFQTVIEQMPGYFLWKDLNSVYLLGCSKTARLFGLNKAEDLCGTTDYQIPCEAANHADLFLKQDEKVKKMGKPILLLDIHPYANGEIKTLLINKSLLKNELGIAVGINCYCLEITNKLMRQVARTFLHANPTILQHGQLVKAANFYLHDEYEGLQLSKRQSECLFYLIRGKSMPAIAKLLKLSTRTIESHVEQIKQKMNCNSKADLIDKAITLGYFDIIPSNIICKNLPEILF